MAAVTFTKGPSYEVIGNRRSITGVFNTAGTADTFASGLVYISTVVTTPGTNTALGNTISGGTVTFVTAGATTGNTLLIVGL